MSNWTLILFLKNVNGVIIERYYKRFFNVNVY